MKQQNHKRSGIFLLEIMIAILFFALTGAVCLRTFVKAHTLSTQATETEQALSRLPEHTSRALNREYEDKLVFTVCRRAFSRLFLPVPVQTAIALFRSVKYIRAGLSACCTANSLSPCSTRRP